MKWLQLLCSRNYLLLFNKGQGNNERKTKKRGTHLCCAAVALLEAIGDLAGNPVALGLPLSTYSATRDSHDKQRARYVNLRWDINNNPRGRGMRQEFMRGKFGNFQN